MTDACSPDVWRLGFHPTSILLVSVVFAGAVGCGGSNSDNQSNWPAAKLHGKVTLDGQPLTGNLSFVSQDPKIASVVSAKIVNGQYSASDVPLGKTKVLISALQATGKKEMNYDKEVEIVMELVPEKYREGIDVDITADTSEQDFLLTTR